MAFPISYIFLAGGIAALTPLLSRISKGLGKFVSAIGFFIGIAILVVSAILAFNLSIVQLDVPSAAQLVARSPWLQYFLPILVILGVLLFSRPIRNVRWASLLALGLGVLTVYGVRTFLGVTETLILGIAFLIVAVLSYALLKFVEDLFEFVAQFLALPPVEIILGLVGVYFGILMMTI